MTDEQTAYIVDDESDQRAMLADLLTSAALPVRTFDSAEAFLEELRPDAAGCVVLDLRMRGMGGLRAQQELLTRRVAIPVIFWTAHATVEVAVRAIRDGAFDLIEKPATKQRLIETVRSALAKDGERRGRRQRIADYRARADTLTTREREIAALVLDGTPSKAISIDLAISEKTVEVHRSRILKKMNVASTTDFLTEALQVLQAVSMEPSRDGPPTFADWVDLLFGARRGR